MNAPVVLRRTFFGSLIGVMVVLATGGSLSAEAAIAPLQVKPGRLSPPIRTGAIAGGEAAEEFSILKVETRSAGSKKERLVISYGDRNGQPIQREPGFFQVALDRKSRRVIIDLAQVTRTAVDSKDLAKILASSRFVATSDMTMDPQDGSTNITLNLRSAVAMSVLTEDDGQGRIVIELQEQEAGSRP